MEAYGLHSKGQIFVGHGFSHAEDREGKTRLKGAGSFETDERTFAARILFRQGLCRPPS
jgi:hypothetical protein